MFNTKQFAPKVQKGKKDFDAALQKCLIEKFVDLFKSNKFYIFMEHFFTPHMVWREN